MKSKTCIIAPHEIARERLRRELAVAPIGATRSYAHSNPFFFVVSPGDMPCGVHFDDVIVTPEAHEKIATCERHRAWFDTCIKVRMTREANVIVVQ